MAIGLPLCGLAIGAAAGTLARDDAPTRVLGGPVEGSTLARLDPVDDAPKEAKSSAGFTVEFQKSSADVGGGLVVYYRVAVDGSSGFADMLGIPRVINPDGSIVLPSEYGSVGSQAGALGGIPGVPGGSLGAVYDRAAIQPGAVMRFGPFFRSADQGVTLTATGAELAPGVHTTIGNESFVVTSVQNKDGTTAIQFVNVQSGSSAVATHPGSKPSVVIDGKPVEQVHGSTNFAKTVGYDVNANRSSIDIAAVIDGTASVRIAIDSIGFVHGGDWDFPLD